MSISIICIAAIVQQPQAGTGSKIQFITFLVYFILGLILGYLIRHLFGILNIPRKLREKKLHSDLQELEKRISTLEEENAALKAELNKPRK